MNLKFVFMISLILVGHSFSQSLVQDVQPVQIPFAGEPSVSPIEGVGGQFKLTMEKGKAKETAVIVYEQGLEIGRVYLGKNITLYSVMWRQNEAWMLLRKQTGGSSRVVGIASFNSTERPNQFRFFGNSVKTDDASGRVFDLLKVEERGLRVVFSIRDEKTSKISYYGGLLQEKNMVEMKKDARAKLVDEPEQSSSEQ